MKPLSLAALALLSLILLAPSVSAQASPIAIGVKASPLGAGVELWTALGRKGGLRVGYQAYSYDDSFEQDGIDYDAELDLSSGTLLLDWHPTAGLFRLTLGGLYNDNSLDVVADTSRVTIEVGDTTYSGEQIESLTGTLGFDSFAPYAGFGWSNVQTKGRGFGFSFDLGAVLQGKPGVDLVGVLDSSVPADVAAQFQVDLEAEEKTLEEDLTDYEILPILSLTLTYRF